MRKPAIEIADSLTGLRHIGYKRTDLPMFHTIVASVPGAKFQVDDHFERCEVCREHRITQDDFYEFMTRPN